MSTPAPPFSLRWFATIVGLLLLCLIIWFAGPYFAFAEVKPLESASARWLTIVLVVVVWALVWQWRQWRAWRASQQLVQGSDGAAPGAGAASGTGGGSAAATGGVLGAADAQLSQRFQEATAALRKTKSGATTLLELPWYMIIGPPGAGKTTAFKNSGLEFPLADQFGKGAIRGVGGTRSCDWWFTKEAILLDTAGRYVTQESGAQADSAGWIAFLQLLKKHRRRRPVNGVLLAISIEDLLVLDDAGREKHVRAIRDRLQELHRYLGVRLPVYVLLTKADLIAGFTEYFDDLDAAARAQVWGVTFPLEASREGRAPQLLDAELDDLVGRLAARVPDRLQAERDAQRRRAVFAFPQQVASLKGGITTWVGEIFSGTGQDEVWLRGVYLTSGTQEGTPIDRMLSSLARTFGLGVQGLGAPRGPGKAFFVNKLLRQVIFGESGLAGADRKVDLRAAATSGTLYFVIAGLAVLAVVALLVSYRSNTAYLEQVDKAAQVLKGIKSAGPQAQLADTVPPLDALGLVVEAATREHVPLSMRWGLSQVGSMTDAAEDAYTTELNTGLAPAVARDLAQRIESSQSQPDRLYEYLKAYLMLGEPKQLRPAEIKQITDAEWTEALPRDAETAARVGAHFNALIDRHERLQPVILDPSLVERARISLRQASMPVLIYSRVRLSYAGDSQRAVRLDKELGLGAQSVFVRRSGRGLSEPLPALYTRPVFDEFNAKGKPLLVTQFLEDGWVFGDQAPSVTQSPRLAADVVSLYEQDYIRSWDAVLADLTVRSPRDPADAAAIMGTLASPTSPLKRLLVLVDTETNLLKAPPAGDVTAAAASQLTKLSDRATAALGGAPAAKPGTLVTEHFAALQALVAGPPGQAPIDHLLGLLGQAQQQLQASSSLTGQPGSPAALAAIQTALGAVQSEAAQMPPVVSRPMTELVASTRGAAQGVAHGDLANRYATQVVAPCRELLGAGYPFNRSASADVTLEDFGRVFGTGGLYDAFFQSNLTGLADTSRTPWRWRTGAEGVGGSDAILTQFQAAGRVRDLFFAPGGQTPAVRFTLTPSDLDADVDRFRLDVDGQSLEYHHGPPRAVSMNWPGGPVGQVVATFEMHDGTHPQLAFQGPWALFRLLDQSTLQQQSPTRFLVTVRLNGKQAQLLLDTASIRNPFAHPELTTFRCGG
jgi:type VI secretion system protein ImpL